MGLIESKDTKKQEPLITNTKSMLLQLQSNTDAFEDLAKNIKQSAKSLLDQLKTRFIKFKLSKDRINLKSIVENLNHGYRSLKCSWGCGKQAETEDQTTNDLLCGSHSYNLRDNSQKSLNISKGESLSKLNALLEFFLRVEVQMLILKEEICNKQMMQDTEVDQINSNYSEILKYLEDINHKSIEFGSEGTLRSSKSIFSLIKNFNSELKICKEKVTDVLKSVWCKLQTLQMNYAVESIKNSYFEEEKDTSLLDAFCQDKTYDKEHMFLVVPVQSAAIIQHLEDDFPNAFKSMQEWKQVSCFISHWKPSIFVVIKITYFHSECLDSLPTLLNFSYQK